MPGKNFSDLLKQYDYDPKKNASVSRAALQEILRIFIVDIHNQSPHPELKSAWSKVWEKAIKEFPPALPPSSQELNVLIGAITHRVISRRGVEFSGLLYNSPELARVRSIFEREKKSEKATIKFNPTDLSRIYVFNPQNDNFLCVSAINQEYTKGLTMKATSSY